MNGKGGVNAPRASGGAGANFGLVSTDAGATAGPELDLYRNSASPAANDILGVITFSGNDGGAPATKTAFARIQAVLLDPTDTSEDGALEILAMGGGTERTALRVLSTAGEAVLMNARAAGVGTVSFQLQAAGTWTRTGYIVFCETGSAIPGAGTTKFAISGDGAYQCGSDGSASAPQFTRTTDLDTGIFFPTTNQVAITCGASPVLIASSTGVGFGPGGTTPAVVADIDGDMAIRAATPAALAAGNNNDYAGLDNRSFGRLSGDGGGTSTITGITDGQDGKFLILVNVSANAITVAHQDANSAAANRIITGTGAAVVLTASDAIMLIYDATTARWRQMTTLA